MWTYAVDPELSLEGDYSVVVTQTDAAGNIGTVTQTVSIDDVPTIDVDLTQLPPPFPSPAPRSPTPSPSPTPPLPTR